MIMTSREDPKDRNYLSPDEAQVVDRYRSMVARELKAYISADDRRSIRVRPKEELIMLHSSLGTAIRNEYELWMEEHDVTSIWVKANQSHPLMAGEVDNHPCHPDNFSFSCITKLWERLQ